VATDTVCVTAVAEAVEREMPDQVFQACEEPFQLTECTSEETHGCSVIGMCPLKQGMALLHNRMLALLRDLSLAELFGSSSVQLLDLGLARIPASSNSVN
jgi:DNA-binding IscR family transcriptional regulator